MIWPDLKISKSERLVRVKMLFEEMVDWHRKNLKNILTTFDKPDMIQDINDKGISTDRNPSLAVSDFACFFTL